MCSSGGIAPVILDLYTVWRVSVELLALPLLSSGKERQERTE
jgi:hypothetical protein